MQSLQRRNTCRCTKAHGRGCVYFNCKFGLSIQFSIQAQGRNLLPFKRPTRNNPMNTNEN
eukprot:1793561-Amphidinium_carterae.1